MYNPKFGFKIGDRVMYSKSDSNRDGKEFTVVDVSTWGALLDRYDYTAPAFRLNGHGDDFWSHGEYLRPYSPKMQTALGGVFSVGLREEADGKPTPIEVTIWVHILFATYEEAVAAFTDEAVLRKSNVYPFCASNFGESTRSFKYEIWYRPFGLPLMLPEKKGEVRWGCDHKGALSSTVVNW